MYLFVLALNVKISCWISYNLIVQNMLGYQRMNAYNNMFRMHIWTSWILSTCDVVRLISNSILLSR